MPNSNTILITEFKALLGATPFFVSLSQILMMIHIESFRAYCLQKQAVTESLPFDADTLVFKVGSKMFALTSLDSPNFSVNLKCDPERAIVLREAHPAIREGYHMSKKHWNTVAIDGSLPDDFIWELIDHSYDLVVRKMTRKEREMIGIEL